MLRHEYVSASKAGMRAMMAIMFAVVLSMTLHHGTMAVAAEQPTGHAYSMAGHHGAEECVGVCGDAHELLVCCGMGLCLSGLPAAPHTTVPIELQANYASEPRTIEPRRSTDRIDRPPKSLDRAA
ncbi:hypothetical protein [Devosia rhizoryzae]|uniref:DUF2946 domain-containing protein n=1 Tax=Devosia rhizoryzae TaxID=2774137 RepID=A0ABX7C9Y8_9HYPH|nr:hypothetical protein [Devosia rhizoryzae]QQR40079.1 hypothetical protein JI748_03430 [Devosia rhizoryzae]